MITQLALLFLFFFFLSFSSTVCVRCTVQNSMWCVFPGWRLTETLLAIIAHYCQWTMTSICPAVILTRSQPITITTLNGLDIDFVCLKHRKQQQMANFTPLRNLLLPLYIFTFSHFFLNLFYVLCWQPAVHKVSPLVSLFRNSSSQITPRKAARIQQRAACACRYHVYLLDVSALSLFECTEPTHVRSPPGAPTAHVGSFKVLSVGCSENMNVLVYCMM